jgi:hypothetical protein
MNHDGLARIGRALLNKFMGTTGLGAERRMFGDGMASG